MMTLTTYYYEDIYQFDKITARFLTVVFDFLLINIIFSNAFMVLRLPHVFLSFISLLRDVSIFIILFFLGLKNISIKNNVQFLCIYLSILFFVPVFILIGNVIDGNNQARIAPVIRGIWWTVRPFTLFLILINYKKFYMHKMDLGKFLIISSVFMFFISIIFYKFLPGMIASMRFSNRISLGNPSMQSSIFIGALIVLLDTLPFKKRDNFFCLIVLGCAVLCAISLTGIACLAVILIAFLLEKNTHRYLIPFFIISALIILLFVLTNDRIATYVSYFYERIGELQTVLRKYLISHGGDSGSNSFRARERQIEGVIKTLEISSYFFGCGDMNCTGGRFGIENFYYALITNYGVAGVFAFVIIQLKILINAVFEYKHARKITFFVFLVYLNFYSTSLDLINTYSLSSIFIFVGFILYQRRKLK